jgi:hypothetical protein
MLPAQAEGFGHIRAGSALIGVWPGMCGVWRERTFPALDLGAAFRRITPSNPSNCVGEDTDAGTGRTR